MSTLQFKNIEITINNNQILHNINFELANGEFIMLLGSNGCGKSSLLKTIYREYQASSGTIELNNKALHKYSGKEFYNKVALLNQNFNQMLFNDLNIIENYRIFSQQQNKKAEMQFIAQLQRYNARFEMMDKLANVKVGLLSGGQKQTLALLLLISRNPELILLDEHTSALDKNAEQQLMQLTHEVLQQQQISCIMITHNLDIASQYSDRTIILKDGKIATILPKQHYSKSTFLEYF